MQDFVRDAFAHVKAIAFTNNTTAVFAKAGLDDAGIAIGKRNDVSRFIETAALGKYWEREPKVRPTPGAREIPEQIGHRRVLGDPSRRLGHDKLAVMMITRCCKHARSGV